MKQLCHVLVPKLKHAFRIATVLQPYWMLVHFIFYLRHHPKIRIMASLFEISVGTSCRLLHITMPHVYEVCSYLSCVEWPRKWKSIPVGFMGAQFLIDCTSHPRKRVHPGQHLFYRGDKGFHFVTAQVIVDIFGRPLSVVIGLGHNNDKGVYKLSGKKEEVEMLNISGLSDRGYKHTHLIRPDDEKCASMLGIKLTNYNYIFTIYFVLKF